MAPGLGNKLKLAARKKLRNRKLAKPKRPKKHTAKMKMLLTSGGPDQHMGSLNRLLKSHLKKSRNKTRRYVRVVCCADADPQDSLKKDKAAVMKAVRKRGYIPKVTTYKFYENLDGVNNASRFLGHERSIVLVCGGNTFKLNAGLREAPKFRKKLIKAVRGGHALYISRSAGTILAGRSVSIATDDKQGIRKVSKRGLCLVGKKTMRPHFQTPHAKAACIKFKRKHKRAKVLTLIDGKALVINGKKRKVVGKN